LQFQVFVMQHSGAIINYEENFKRIEKSHEDHLWCQLPS